MRTLIWILLLCVWSVMPTSAQIASLVQNPQVKKLPVRSVHCIYPLGRICNKRQSQTPPNRSVGFII